MKDDRQLHLFPTIYDWTELSAESPQKAFWRLSIEEEMGRYYLIKESGCDGKVRDTRRWGPYEMGKAVQLFERKVLEKLNPDRGSPRKYKMKRPAKKAVPIRQRRKKSGSMW